MPLGLSKKFVKRSLCNGRCTIGIRDAETFNKGYMTRAVPLGLSKKVAKRSLCNSRCAIGIPDAENFEKKVYGTRCTIGTRCKLVCEVIKYLSVRNVAAKFGYFSVFCWRPLFYWDCHKMM